MRDMLKKMPTPSPYLRMKQSRRIYDALLKAALVDTLNAVNVGLAGRARSLMKVHELLYIQSLSQRQSKTTTLAQPPEAIVLPFQRDIV